jgi:hypothetical protein
LNCWLNFLITLTLRRREEEAGDEKAIDPSTPPSVLANCFFELAMKYTPENQALLGHLKGYL